MKQNIARLIIFTIAFSLTPLTLAAQDAETVRGLLVDANTKETLVGVSVMLLGSQQGTVSDFDGAFEIRVPSLKSAKLKFTYIGYSAIEIPLEGRNYLRVELKENTQLIDEIVVIGYGKQKKESVIGSISSIDNKTLVSLPVSNISQALAGKLPGVQVVQPSGEVGKDEANIYIRGMATYGDAKPLYIVDGIVRESFSQIDPNEIQSFNVLKDASATAVYGVKGANGVIIITTRRGATGKPQVAFSAQSAITQPTRIPNPLGSYQAAALKNLHKMGGLQNDDYTALDILKYRTGASPYTHPDVRWVDEAIKDNSTMQQYNVNVSGGTEFVKYFISGGYFTQDGFYNHDDNTRFSRYNFRSNLDFNISKQFTAAFNLGSRIEKRTYPGRAWYGSWDIYRGAFATSGRDKPVYNPDGSLGGSDSQPDNLIGLLDQSGIYKNTTSVVEMSLNTKYKMDFITKGLAARGQVAFDNSGSNGALWQQSFAVYDYDLSKDSYKRIGEDSYLNYSWADNSFNQKLYLELGLEYEASFGKHSVTGLFLANRNNRIIKTYVAYADQGLVGRATYDYDKRYFLEINVGYNGSENFAKGNRYGFFPAFAGGWMISNESFIKDSPIAEVLSIFKVRGSLGWVGNDRVGGDIASNDYQSKRFIYIQSYANQGGASFGSGDSWNAGIRQGRIANLNVTWERARKANIGFETSFWNDLIGLNVDVFQERRVDILTDIGSITPSHVGASFMAANVGVVENKGFEIDLSHRNKIGRNFSYSLKGNFSFARNKVIQKADPQGMLPYQKEEGYSIGVPKHYKQIGIFQDYNDIFNSPNQMTIAGNMVVAPGDLKYLDFNGDGFIDSRDAFRQGYGEVPEIQYGITTGAAYKGLDFSILFQGSGRAQFPKNWESMWHFSNNDNVFQKHWSYWSPEISGQEEYLRIYGAYQNNEPSPDRSSYSDGSGDYVRLKTLELGYTLPTKITSKLNMSGVRIYFSGNNLALWAKEPYLDPDNRDQRAGVMPQTRAFNFGLNVNF